MGVEFRLLGDVEARLDGRKLDMGHARQRCILVALLVDVNHAIPLDQLVDRIWVDRPPYHASNAVAGYLSRLRNLLAGAKDVVISRESGGCVLRTDALSIDLHRFRHLAGQARTTADPGKASAVFDLALGTWRGEPFAALDTPWLNDVRTALQAERYSVVLDRNDVALRAGRHDELLVDLTAALSAHPLDERLAGQVMLAQFRSGRQADALDTYRQMRERLVEELGVDPGPSLRTVHHQILHGDAGGGPAEQTGRTAPLAAARPAGVLTRPDAGLPRRATAFVNREQELRGVREAMHEGPLVTLTGVGGVGKTRLALEAASRGQENFADGVWICELAPVDSVEAVSHTIAAALKLQHQQGLDIAESVIEYLRARQALLVVDNCEHVLDAVAKLLERIVQHCPRVSVLATSREPLGIEGERMVPVAPLPMQDATMLFSDRARASQPDFRLDDQPAGAVAEICRRVDCLPLAVELAAARMRMMSSREIVRRLDDLHLLRGGPRSALPRQQSLTATIDWSYRLLTESEQSLFLGLSVFAGGFTVEAAHRVCGEHGAGEDETLELLASLVDKSMVIVRGGTDRTRYGLLETLRAFGRNALQDKGLHDRYATCHAVYYTELAERAAAGVQGPDEQQWVEWMLPDYDNLRAAFEHAMAGPDVDLALRLVTSLGELIGMRIGYEVAEWAERVIRVTEPDHPLFAAAAGTAARGVWNWGDLSHARHLANLAKGRVPGTGTARVSYPGDVLADVALFEGDVHGTQAYWAGEAARARRDGDQVRFVWTQFMLAVGAGALGIPDVALPAARESVTIAEAIGNPTARAMAYFALGYLLKKSDPERALTLLDEAARLARTVHNFWNYGIALMEAAATRAVHADPATAARMFIDVLDHWDRVGDWSEQWIALRYISRLLVRLGADEDALFLASAFINAGKPSPLNAVKMGILVDRVGADRVDAISQATGDGAAVVARVRSAIQSLVEAAGASAV